MNSSLRRPQQSRLWHALRLALPRWYRDEYGDELVSHHLERFGAAGPRFWMGLAWDSTVTGIAARAQDSERKRRSSNGGAPHTPQRRSPGPFDMIERIFNDFRHAARGLWNDPVFSLSAALTLAIGIGANAAVFSVIYAVLLQPMPYPDAEELMFLRGTRSGEVRGTMSYPNLMDLRDTSSTLDIAAFTGGAATLLGHGAPQQLSGAFVTERYFDILGATPAHGRFFVDDDHIDGAGRTVVVDHGTWERVFGGDPDLVGSAITLDDSPALVIGIAPAGFVDPFVGQNGYWEAPAPDRGRTGRSYNGIARVRDGATVLQADEELAALMAGLEEAYPDDNPGRSAILIGLKDLTVGAVQPTLIMFSVAAGLVLLIVCANVANLFLGRATTRERELIMRRVLGAGRGSLLQRLAAESLLLTSIGAGIGMLGAYYGTSAIVSLAANRLPRGGDVGLNGQVVLFTAGLSILTAILFGLGPALFSARGDLAASLRTAGQHGGSHSGTHRLRHSLVVAEIAFTMVLLVGAGLLIQSMVRLQGMDMGVDTDNVLTFRISPSAERHPEGEPLDVFFGELVGSIESHPDVVRAGVSWAVPIAGFGNSTTALARVDGVMPDGVEEMRGQERAVTPGFFDAGGMRIVRGRGFTHEDTSDAQPVVVVSESFANRFYFDGEALGATLIVRGTERRIVGILADVRQRGLGRPTEPGFWIPHAQEHQDWLRRFSAVIIRTAGDPAAISDHARNAVWAIDDTIPVTQLQTMDNFLQQQSQLPRLRATLLTVFAAIAIALACVGIVGIMSYTVLRRVPEIGVRMALGARSQDVVRQVLMQGMRLAAAGLAIGAVGSLALSRYLQTMLFEVDAYDPVTMVGTAALLTLVSAAACWFPAWRASRIDPLRALRSE